MRLPNISRILLVVAFLLAPASAISKAKTASAADRSATSERCDWNRPGHRPFMGDVVGAVDRYTDIPTDVRTRLKARMAERQYDEIVSIRRDSIVGKADYSPTIRDMHFGPGRVCKQVSRAKWTAAMQERGLVYCEDRHCILVPTVCRNVSRIARTGVGNESAGGGGGSGGGNQGGGGIGSGSGSGGDRSLGGTDYANLPPTSAGPLAQALDAGGGGGGGGLIDGNPAFAPAAGTEGGPTGLADASGMSIGSAPGGTGGTSATPASFAPGGIGQPFIASGPVIAVGPGSGGVVVVQPPVVPVTEVPEPATVLTLIAGLAALAGFSWARRRGGGRARR